MGDGAYCLSASYGGTAGGGNDMLALCYKESSSENENSAWDSAPLRNRLRERLEQAAMPREVLAVAERAERCYQTSVYYRNPLLRWRRGDAVLAGDAAHAMPPFLGQGANQAICDGFALALALKQVGGQHATVSSALEVYQRKRLFSTARLQLNSRFLGFVETQQGKGAEYRNTFFTVMGKLGIAEAVFIDGANVRV